MRQNDGSELLGPNDPRNLVIGIIHVTPGDDRESVMTAIQLQEQQQRDQIVLDIPTQNKAFKTAADFEGLRQLASAIEATIVVVAPARSKLATLARKESFTVYPSLDELTSAEFPPLEPESAEENEAQTVVEEPAISEESEHTDPVSAEPALPEESEHTDPALETVTPPLDEQPASVETAPAPEEPQAASEEEQTDPALEAVTPIETDTEGITEKVPAVGPVSVSQEPAIEDDESDHVHMFPAKTPPVEEHDPTTHAVPSAETNAQDEDDGAPTEVMAVPTGLRFSKNGSSAEAGSSVESEDEGRTAVLPQDPASDVEATPDPATTTSQVPEIPVYLEPPEPSFFQRWRRLILVAVSILVLAGLALFLYHPILDLFFPASATVTIVPDSQMVKHSYQMTAVLGVPDAGKDQVQARALYATSPTQNKTVNATGQGHTTGQQAQGELTFYNLSNTQQSLPANTVVLSPHAIAVATNQALVLPALASKTVAAHTINVGNNQNIPALEFNHTICCNGSIFVSNQDSFTGGLDAHTYTYVQQSDIDGVAKTLEPALEQQATQTLKGEVQATEQFASSPRCQPQVSSDHQAGETASTVTVNVTANCLGEVYNMQQVQALAATKLGRDASQNPGPAYALVGTVLIHPTPNAPDNQGNVRIPVDAWGIWTYQFDAAARAHLASLIAGKSSQDAQALLLKQPGVHSATIALSGSGANTLTKNTSKIKVTVAPIHGL